MPMTGRTNVSESLKTILICVDSYDDLLLKGELYHNTFNEGKPFFNLMQLLLSIEDILNDMGFPRPTTEKRRFSTVEGILNFTATSEAAMDLQVRAGKLATFKLKVMFRQNASWQGSVAWIEGSSEEPFRSALELIMLIDSALRESKAK